MNRLVLFITSIGLLFAGAAFSQEDSPPILALTNVTVIDGTGAEPVPDMTILIEGERIRDVFPTGAQPLPENAEVMDLSGRYVIPGLIDTHFHLVFSRQHGREAMYAELERQLYGGVIALSEMAGDARITAKAKRNIGIGERIGPDIEYVAVMAGPQFAVRDPRFRLATQGLETNEAAWIQKVDENTDVVRTVARASGTHARGLKLYMEINQELSQVLTEEAHRQGLKVWAHPHLHPSRPIEVVRAGVDVVSHVCGLRWQSVQVTPPATAWRGMEPRAVTTPEQTPPDAPEMIELYEEMAARGVILDATYSFFYHHPGPAEFGCPPELATAFAKAAREHGVEFSTGTDYLGPEDDPYPALHMEIEHLVDHGILSPREALTAATVNGARALGREDDYGSIGPGKLASMVVLERNPLKDIRALRTVETVFKRGVGYPRSDYRMPKPIAEQELSGEQRHAIKAELKGIRKQRYEALERGDCDTVIETFDENVTLYTTRGMRVQSADVIWNSCRNLPRPLPRPILEEEEVHVISNDAGWTLHVLEFEPRNAEPGVIRREVVTLIWRKSNEGWRTIHFHASLNPVPDNLDAN